MIYVKRNTNMIPERVLKVAERAQQELEALPAEERKGFIVKKAHVWRAFSRYLSNLILSAVHTQYFCWLISCA